MVHISTFIFLTLAGAFPLTAGTVVVTSLPDESHPLDPLTTPGGIPLSAGVQVRVGAFPGSSDADLLNAASTGGFAQLSAAFVSFGAPCSIGEGVDGSVGRFEIAVRQSISDSQSPLIGETISLLIQQGTGQEFLVARFSGKVFQADSATGLEPVLSLHLADAKIVVGNRYGTSHVSTSTAPEVGSFDTWIQSFPTITDPAKRLPDADADGDGRSNFLEYATGGDPAFPADPPPCQILTDEAGAFWIRFSRAAGTGVPHEIETSADLVSPWFPLDGTIEPDPDPPSTGGSDWLRIRVPQPAGAKGFYRLSAEP